MYMNTIPTHPVTEWLLQLCKCSCSKRSFSFCIVKNKRQNQPELYSRWTIINLATKRLRSTRLHHFAYSLQYRILPTNPYVYAVSASAFIWIM